MKFLNPLFLLFFFLLGIGSHAQNQITLTGRVLEQATQQPLPNAVVQLKSTGKHLPMGGTTTDNDGYFSLNMPVAAFKVEVSFFGYQTKTIAPPQPKAGKIDLGNIFLEESASQLEEVEVSAEQSTVEFSVDKRVFNVGQDLASTGMGALEVLDNVPSVNVDVEGQISLRGNTGVQILIDGKPSVLADEGSNALGTITADMIERIELITNPSAKYEAEGSTGIINIVLKKEEQKGTNGSVSINTGIPHNHSIGFSLNSRTKKFNLFTQMGAGYRSLPRYKESENYNLLDSTIVLSEGTEYRNEVFYNIRLGADYYLNKYNVITLSGNFAFEDEDQPSETNFSILDGGTQQLISKYQRVENTTAENPKYQYDLQYKKQFRNHEDHVLLFSSLGSFFGKEQSSEFINTTTEGVSLDPNQLTATNFFQRDFNFKLDYTNPISKTFTLEAGAQYDINDVGNDYEVRNELPSGGYEIDTNLTNDFNFDQSVLGIYTTAAYEGTRWGAKLGARVENTHLYTLLENTQEENEQNYTNLFPSAHLSYKFTEYVSVQAGYSRRIRRPRLWDLNPFFNIRNNYNVRRGNPNLLPEFADSYEITGIWVMKKASLNTSVYYLCTTEVIERVSFLEDNVNVTMPINIGTKNQIGFELNAKYTPYKWWVLNGDFNFGYFNRDGSTETQSFDFTGTQWFTKLSSRFKLKRDIEIELSADYNSPYKTIQGEISGFAFADIGVRKKIWKGKGVFNLSVRDIFASRIRENNVVQPGFILYDFSQRGRFFTLGFSYSFGKGEAMTYSGRRR